MGSGNVGDVQFFEYDPGAEWLLADGRVVDWTAALGPLLTPTATAGLVVGSSSAISATLRGGCYGAGKFVLGIQGGFYVSTDLQTFTPITVSGEAGSMMSVVFAKGMFVALSSSGKVWISADALNWTLAVTLGSPFASGTSLVSFVAGLFVIVTTGSSNTTYLTSPDAATWTQRTLPADVLINIQDMASDGSLLVVASGNNARLFSTKDAINWTRVDTGTHIPTLANVVEGLIYVGGALRQGASVATWLLSDDGSGASYQTVQSFVPADNTVHRVGEEVIEIGGGSGNIYLNAGRKGLGVSGTPISGRVRILTGNGLMLMYGINSQNFIRSTKVRLPRAYRRPDAPNLKPYVKVA